MICFCCNNLERGAVARLRLHANCFLSAAVRQSCDNTAHRFDPVTAARPSVRPSVRRSGASPLGSSWTRRVGGRQQLLRRSTPLPLLRSLSLSRLLLVRSDIFTEELLPSSCVAGGSLSILNSSLVSSSEPSFPSFTSWMMSSGREKLFSVFGNGKISDSCRACMSYMVPRWSQMTEEETCRPMF